MELVLTPGQATSLEGPAPADGLRSGLGYDRTCTVTVIMDEGARFVGTRAPQETYEH